MNTSTRHSSTADLERLLIENRIEQVLRAYCQGVDRRDWEQVRSCYHDDAIDSHGQFTGSPDELVCWLQDNHVHVTSSMHMLTNVSIRFDEDDARLAGSESYCLSLKEVSSAADDPFLGATGGVGRARRTVACRYIDTFEDRPGVGWRILARQVTFEWVRCEPDEPYRPLDPNWVVSRRDRSDLLYTPLTRPTGT
jgi:hypothetical protein